MYPSAVVCPLRLVKAQLAYLLKMMLMRRKLTCRFYGDVVLPSHPATFQEAVIGLSGASKVAER